MDISRQFINNPTRVWLAILLLGVGGLFALLNIGRLEDPAFTIKTRLLSRWKRRLPCRWKTRFSSFPRWITSAPSPRMAYRKLR